MDKYKIPCTEEQTKKALELGAPINIFIHTSSESKGNYKPIGEFIDAVIPTAEQMIGWLEEQDGIDEITVCKTGMWIWGKNRTLIKGSPNYSSRQESSLAAIDAALEYLTNKEE